MESEDANRSLVKYVNDNGVAVKVVEYFAEALKWKEDGRKKRLEEIGKGDAWFKKQTGEAPIEKPISQGVIGATLVVEELGRRKIMRETLIYLSHLDDDDTEKQMLRKLSKQLSGEDWTWNNLNTLCRAIGSISCSMMEEQIDRKLVKQTVRTSVYGVTFVGAREQIKRRLEEKGLITDEKLLFAAACYAAKVTLTALGEIFGAARVIMGWLGDCAKVIAFENQPVRWTTPLGLPVVQPFCKTERHLIAREVLDVAAPIIQPSVTTDEIDRVVHAATIAASANFNVEAVAVQLTQREGELIQEKSEVKKLTNFLKQFRLAYVSPESTVVGAGHLVDHPKKIALHYLKGYFLFDLFLGMFLVVEFAMEMEIWP
ncbi:hypothetical protein JHK87_010528 [Glycine soja]|nr:hypothetical protein JHK87_010528 [Glycine soja]